VRRVVEAMAPKLPKEVGGGPITVLTRGIMTGSVAVTLPPQPSVRIVIHSQDPDAASAFAGLVRLALLAGRDQLPRPVTNLLGALVRPPSPKIEGDRVIFTVDEKSLLSLARQFPEGPRRGALAAYRVKSASNIRQLILACLIYANEHKNEFPDSLEESLKGMDMPRDVMTNPSDPARKPGYVYVKPPPLKDLAHADSRVVVYEAFDAWDTGINVGFADGHAEFIQDQAVFVKLLNDAGAKLDKR
ncbi:MAG: hypothetical protein JWL69_2944, partial [Phycisphaerales bacterium]|nr:hypothetical protein [Phycisphaerales bacterium]